MKNKNECRQKKKVMRLHWKNARFFADIGALGNLKEKLITGFSFFSFSFFQGFSPLFIFYIPVFSEIYFFLRKH